MVGLAIGRVPNRMIGPVEMKQTPERAVEYRAQSVKAAAWPFKKQYDKPR
jgi:hypothetical protein